MKYNFLSGYKPIPEYEQYLINNKGDIINTKTGVNLKQSLNIHGYLKVALCKNGKSKTFCVHRLVAKVFVPNPNNYNVVNHKDEIKTNNSSDNLEWCTTQYNHNYGQALIKNGNAHKKPIVAINNNHKIIADSFTTFAKIIGVTGCITVYKKYKCRGYVLNYASDEEIDLLGDKEFIKIPY